MAPRPNWGQPPTVRAPRVPGPWHQTRPRTQTRNWRLCFPQLDALGRLWPRGPGGDRALSRRYSSCREETEGPSVVSCGHPAEAPRPGQHQWPGRQARREVLCAPTKAGLGADARGAPWGNLSDSKGRRPLRPDSGAAEASRLAPAERWSRAASVRPVPQRPAHPEHRRSCHYSAQVHRHQACRQAWATPMCAQPPLTPKAPPTSALGTVTLRMRTHR